MSTKKLLGVAFAVLFTGALIADDVVLNPNHPERYVVVKGDTLWDISSRFLRDPWLWPEIWYVNPQVENPHLIYPGDVLKLVYVEGRPQVRVESGTGLTKLSPTVRARPIEDAIPTIPVDAIEQFLTRPLVVEKGELEKAPYLVEHADEHLVTGAGDRIYVRGIEGTDGTAFSVYRAGQTYIDPDTGETLGYEAIFVGDASAERFGDPSTLALTNTTREARIGDRLRPADNSGIYPHFLPHSPPPGVTGRIIAVHDGVTQIGQFQVVVINRGAADGMEAGHVLEIYRAGALIPDTVSKKHFDKVQLPDEKAGLLMVFRTFDRVSFALVMKAVRSIHVGDKVATPGTS
jgi:LysM repeat protein